MNRGTKLGIAATSLAAAAAMVAPATASADGGVICDPKLFCPGPGDEAFIKFGDAYAKVEAIGVPVEDVYIKLADVYVKLTPFIKLP